MDSHFISLMRASLGEQADALVASLDGEQPVSVRYNPCKVERLPDMERVPWCEQGVYLASRPRFTLDPLFHAGTYYVQEASSMFVGHLLSQAFGGETEGLKILDLCASPGGKTTLYSSLVGPDGLVVANETVRSRVPALCDNVNMWGVGNVAVTNNDPSHFASLGGWFDVVAVDAPCSGEGMFRKNPEARGQWSEDAVKLCASRQRRIVSDVWSALRDGGVMIYSTCTFNRFEDEDNVAWMAETFDCEPVDVAVPDHWGIVSEDVSGVGCYHFYPHKVKGEGFFAAVLRKRSGEGRLQRPRRAALTVATKQEVGALSRWVDSGKMRYFKAGDNFYACNEVIFNDLSTVAERMGVVGSGVCMGHLFGGSLKPDHALALACDVNRAGVNMIDLSLDDALNFLAKEQVADWYKMAEGINLVAYDGHPIGWAKRIGNRMNNMLPKELRILNRR